MGEAARILVIDDAPSERRAVAGLLRNAGYRIESATDGEEGLELTRRFRPELVVCDWAMPRMNGAEYCRAVKQDEELRDTYVALLSSRDAASDRVAGLDAGADDYLTKPVDGGELLARVRAGLRARELQRELAELVRRNAVLQLATALGHEINNPLTALYGHFELIRRYMERDDPARAQHHLREAAGVAQRIRDVVRRLTELSNVKTKRYLGDQSMIDLT